MSMGSSDRRQSGWNVNLTHAPVKDIFSHRKFWREYELLILKLRQQFSKPLPVNDFVNPMSQLCHLNSVLYGLQGKIGVGS